MPDKPITPTNRNTQVVNHVALKMKAYHHGDALKVQHFVRVYTLAKSIGELEKLDEKEQLEVELAALLHSVEGDRVAVARDMLKAEGLEDALCMHICHIIDNQENYEHIATLDHQILIEAKLIVEFKENNTPEKEIIRKGEDVFLTNSGKLFLKRAFGI